MKYYYCVFCKRTIALKYKCSHYKSNIHRDNDKSKINKYNFMNRELREMKSHVITHNILFNFYEIQCNCKLIFDIDVSGNVKSNNTLKNTKIPSLNFEKKGLNFSNILEMNITFIINFEHITYEDYLEQPMLMVERLINKKLYKNYGLIKTLDGLDGTLHMTWYETGVAEMPYVSEKDE